MKEYLEQIAMAFKKMHHCGCVYERTVPVREVFQGKTAWEGDVEVFALIDHPKAKRGYAWGLQEPDGNCEITTVLEIPPVTSPQTAVKAAIVAAARQQRQQHDRRARDP